MTVKEVIKVNLGGELIAFALIIKNVIPTDLFSLIRLRDARVVLARVVY